MTYGFADVVQLRQLLDRSEADEQHKRLEQQKLSTLLGFCETVECRRQVLLRYFSGSGDARTSSTDLRPEDTRRAPWASTMAASSSGRVSTNARPRSAPMTEIAGRPVSGVRTVAHGRVYPSWAVVPRQRTRARTCLR